MIKKNRVMAVNSVKEQTPQKVKDLIKKHKSIKLDIGCGQAKTAPDWIGIDYREMPGVDIIHNLEDTPYPLPSECASTALASHVMEHINPHGGVFIDVMNEIWRLLKPGGEFLVAVPYATSVGMFRDPTHCNFINEETWCYFDPMDILYKGGLWEIYKPLPWKIKINSWNENGNLETVLIKMNIKDTGKGVDPYYEAKLKENDKLTKKYA